MQLRFKNIFNNYYLYDTEFEDLIEKEDIKESPIENISTKQWTLINKMNISCGELFQNILTNYLKFPIVM